MRLLPFFGGGVVRLLELRDGDKLEHDDEDHGVCLAVFEYVPECVIAGLGWHVLLQKGAEGDLPDWLSVPVLEDWNIESWELYGEF